MAALLRAYAPRIWARLDHLEIDDPPEAWPLDKPVKRYDPDSRREALLAVSPRSQPAVARRLAADGRAAVRFDDLISA